MLDGGWPARAGERARSGCYAGPSEGRRAPLSICAYRPVDKDTGPLPAAATGHGTSPSRPASPGPAVRNGVRALIVVLCAAGAVAALVAHRSERRLNEIRKLGLTTVEKRVSPAEREDARRRALDLLPSARLLNPDSDVDVQEMVFLERNEARRAARLRELTDREPENIYLWFVRLRNAERAGQPAAARRAYARARALDPGLPPPS